jgi:hypothetical protein
MMSGRIPSGSQPFISEMWFASTATHTWTQSSLVQPAGNGGAAATDSHLYVVGGRNDVGTPLADVFVAALDASGVPTGWTKSPQSLCGPGYALGVAIASGHLYALGGDLGGQPPDKPTATKTACYTTIDPATGDLQPWSGTTPLPVPMRSAVVVATDDHVYVLGGCTDETDQGACMGQGLVTNNVYAAAVQADGSLGEWVVVSMLPDRWTDRGATIFDGRMYVVGGGMMSSGTDEVWTALIEYGGALGEWTATTPAMVAGTTHAHRRPGVTVANGQLVVFENDDQVNETISAPLQ